MSWLDDVQTYLNTALAGYASGTNLFKNTLPDSPAVAMCIYDAGGNPVPHGANVPWSEHVLEVRNRAASDSAAASAAEAVRALLDFKDTVTMGSSAVRWIRADSPPYFIERDPKNRVTYMTRYVLQRTRDNSY